MTAVFRWQVGFHHKGRREYTLTLGASTWLFLRIPFHLVPAELGAQGVPVALIGASLRAALGHGFTEAASYRDRWRMTCRMEDRRTVTLDHPWGQIFSGVAPADVFPTMLRRGLAALESPSEVAHVG